MGTVKNGVLAEMTAGQLRPEPAESDIYGHVRGSLTGAIRCRPGLFARAGAGTLLFDDFHLLRRSAQYLLLGPFDTGEFLPVGANRTPPVSCRLVIGMGEHPDALVERKRLLKDLRYRLKHCIVCLPRLEERREEIAVLSYRFLEQAPSITGVPGGPSKLAPEVIQALKVVTYRVTSEISVGPWSRRTCTRVKAAPRCGSRTCGQSCRPRSGSSDEAITRRSSESWRGRYGNPGSDTRGGQTDLGAFEHSGKVAGRIKSIEDVRYRTIAGS